MLLRHGFFIQLDSSLECTVSGESVALLCSRHTPPVFALHLRQNSMLQSRPPSRETADSASCSRPKSSAIHVAVSNRSYRTCILELLSHRRSHFRTILRLKEPSADTSLKNRLQNRCTTLIMRPLYYSFKSTTSQFVNFIEQSLFPKQPSRKVSIVRQSSWFSLFRPLTFCSTLYSSYSTAILFISSSSKFLS